MKKHFACSLLSALLLLFSCGDSDGEIKKPDDPTIDTPSKITFESEEPVLSDQEGEAKLIFTTSESWSAVVVTTKSEADSWLQIEPKRGEAGKNTITITTNENDTYKDRNAYVSIVTKSDAKQILVTQKKKDAILLSKDKFVVDGDGETITIELKTNIEYKVVIPEQHAEWIKQTTLDTRSGLNEHSESFTIERGELENPREGEIIFKSGDIEEIVHIYQNQLTGIIVTNPEINISEEAQLIEVELRTNIEYDIEVLADWIRLEMIHSDRVDKVVFEVEENSSHDGRIGEILFFNSKLNISDIVTVYQAPEGALILSKNSQSIHGEETTITVILRSNIEYDIIIPDEYKAWITYNPTRALNIYIHEFIIKENSSGEERTGEIIFKDINSELQDKCTVIQRAMVDERDILMLLYNATDGDNWKNNDNWGSDLPLSEWHGIISVNEEGKVISLNFSDNNLSGVVPQEIDELKYLEYLSMEFNYLSGEFPTTIENLKNLKVLSLGYNRFTGELPKDIVDNLPSLSNLSLEGNYFEGTIPESYGRILNRQQPYYRDQIELELHSNNLTGLIPESITSHDKWNKVAFTIVLQSDGYGFNYIPGYYYPDVTFFDLDDSPFSFKNVYSNNKLTLLLRWADWCGPSIWVINEHLKGIYNDFRAKGLEIIGYAPSSDLPDLKEAVRTNNIPWRNARNYDYTTEQYPPKAPPFIPNVIGIDETGKVVIHQIHPLYVYHLIEEYLGSPAPEQIYESTDYSKDGEVMTLQRATKGKGVNIIFMGDGYVDRDMGAGGKYEQAMEEAMESYFSAEPTASYREYFNAYSVKVVSKNEIFTDESETALNTKFHEGTTLIKGDNELCFNYASNIPMRGTLNDTPITVVINKDQYAGTCVMYTSGASIAYVPKSEDEYVSRSFSNILLHESVGHGFGYLADEYVTTSSAIPDEIKEDIDYLYENFGWNTNVDHRNTKEDVRWKHFFNEPNYNYVSLYEGGYGYAKSVWRPEYNSCMVDNVPYFNAPSREAIVKRIMKQAGESYTFEEFVQNDIYEPYRAPRALMVEKHTPLAPPIIIHGSPKSAR